MSFVIDLRAAVRGLLRSPSVTMLAISCLALGVGTSGAMLGLLDALLFRPPAHVAQPEAVRRVYFTFTETSHGVGASSSETSYPVFCDLRIVRAFSAAGAFFRTESFLGRGAEARKVRSVLATPSFLRLLGVQPVQGRLFSDSEGEPGRQGLVALLSYDLWRRSFGGAPDIMGRQVIVGSDSYTIIGVLPSRFTGVDLDTVDLWLPMSSAARLLGPHWAERRGNRFLEIVARLRSGTSSEAAAQEATVVFRAASAAAGKPRPDTRVSLSPVQRAQGPDRGALPVVTWLTGLSWIVLLISCANVASLLLLRGLDRQRELGLRLALGAGSGQVARLILFEGAMLAGLGSAAALLVCRWTSLLLQRLILPDVETPIMTFNPRTLGIVAILTVASGLLSGAVPALWARRKGLIAAIRTGSRERSPGRSRLDAALAAVQIALTLALLAGAGAFARSLHNALHLDLGMDTDHVLVMTTDLESAGYPPRRVDEIYRQAAERVGALAGVKEQSLAATIPFATSVAAALSVPGIESLPEIESGGPYLNAVSASFFTTTGTPIVKGRPFTNQDRGGAAPVAIVNQTMARLLWPDRDPLGRCLKIGGDASPCSEVVGVARDAHREGLQEGPTMQFYVPLGQEPPSLSSRALFVRAAGDPAALRGPLRREVLAVSPDLPFVDVQPLSDLIAPQVRSWRMGTAVLALFSLLALALALVGLYGVIAHAMARRRYEMGVRIALGAQWRDVLWLALRHGLTIGLLGTAAGLALVLGAARFLQPLLFHVSAKDPLVLASAAVLVLALALLASYVPGRRLRRMDPATALRAE